MVNKELLQEFPSKKIDPVNGLAVTADVWKEAHDYHHHHQRFHALFGHGSGVVLGLEVIASDPPDSMVYIQPGIAVDPLGRSIALTEALTYDLGHEADGLLYLLLSYGEDHSWIGDGQDRADDPLYVHIELVVEARADQSGIPCVELARIVRQKRDSLISDAQDAAHPGPNEIDLRFRRQVGARPQQESRLGVICLGGDTTGKQHKQGADCVARAFVRSGWRDGDCHLHIDHNVPLDSGLETYTLLYLVGQGSFRLDQGEIGGLYAYLQGGGTVFVESCRSDACDGGSLAELALSNLTLDLGLELEELQPGHELLREPYLFGAPPPGFETQGSPRVMVSDGMILSTFDYGCLWQGERRGGPAAREEIRAALEWGSNLVAYAIERRRRAKGE